MSQQYKEFLRQKRIIAPSIGFEVEDSDISPVLFDFQKDIVKWALLKGRCAVFLDTGLGKTLIQAEFARLVFEHTNRPVLIIAPLSVAHQTIKMCKDLLGLNIHYARTDEARVHGVNITNFEMADRFNADLFGCVILDESSRLKHESSKQRQWFINNFADVPYMGCYSATPSPNDLTELGGHSEFLRVMKDLTMRGAFFVNSGKGKATAGYELAGHAETAFYEWLSSWSMSARKPSDLGYDDDGFILPPLNETVHEFTADLSEIEAGQTRDGQLKMFVTADGLQDWSKIRQATINQKVQETVEIVQSSNEQFIVWCWYNEEQNKIARLLGDECASVQGNDTPEHRLDAFERFIAGDVRVLVTKAKIAGHGMNFQHCHNMVFCGLSHSFEMYYQAVRRAYRYGQTHHVNVHIVLSDLEYNIWQSVQEKGEVSAEMLAKLIEQVQGKQLEELGKMKREEVHFEEKTEKGEMWTLHQGDCVDWMARMDDNSVDLIVTSPPFGKSLFVYSADARDMANSATDTEFLETYRFAVRENFRILKPGRVAAIHCIDIPAMRNRDGYIGLKDFSGDLIRLFESEGFVFLGRIPIDKNQQAQSIRTRTRALSMQNGLEKDRATIRPALPDYILVMGKPGVNAVPVVNDEVTRDMWVDWANPTWPAEDRDRCAAFGAWPTWYGISESDTLNNKAVAEKYGISDEMRKRLWQEARGKDDRRHICPLQLGTIYRCIKLWSLPGELVLDPFSGYGSTGVVAVSENRRYIGTELKPEYFDVSVQNLEMAERHRSRIDLFDFAAANPDQMSKVGDNWLTKPGALAYFEQQRARLDVPDGAVDPRAYKTLNDAVEALKAVASELELA